MTVEIPSPLARNVSHAGDLDTVENRYIAATQDLPQLKTSGPYKHLLGQLALTAKEQPGELLKWVSALQSQAQTDIALDLLQAGHALNSHNLQLCAKRLQTLLNVNQIENAGEAVASLIGHNQMDERTAYLMALALERNGQHDKILLLYGAHSTCVQTSSRTLAIIIRAHMMNGQIDDALEIGETALTKHGHGTFEIHALIAALYQAKDQIETAINHYKLALELNPEHIKTRAVLGKLLLVGGQPKQAEHILSQVIKAAPELENIRILHIRALKAIGRYEDAVRATLELEAQASSASTSLKRQIISILSLAGHKSAADQRFDTLLIDKEKTLPASFSSGLEKLDGQIDTCPLPEDRLDWAWSMRDTDLYTDRDAWERRVKWGNLADRLILDWLECRTEAAEEAMQHLSDLGPADAALQPVRNSAQGAILASAHIGALYAGPLALELLDIPCRWLASTPGVESAPYSTSLISTSDQTEAAVAKSVMKTMDEGNAIVIAVDGAMSMSAPRVAFEGRQVTYSAFASRLAYKRKAISFFVAPFWTPERKLDFYIRPMPNPQTSESAVEFSSRWREDYFQHIRHFLRGAPENLRLAGGIWRNRL